MDFTNLLQKIGVSRELTQDVTLLIAIAFVSFIFGIFVLLIIALAIYIFLQEWYKHNYEIHLFKDKSELYNLMNFIQNARKQGLNDNDIRKKLKSSKWSGEQINYAINKLDGKRVGMWEIPVFKFWHKRKMQKEMAKNAQPKRVI